MNQIGSAQNVVLYCCEIGAEFRCEEGRFEEWGKIFFKRRIVGKRKVSGAIFEEEIEWVVNRHLCDQFHLDGKFLHFFREDKSRIPIRERILVPVDKMFAPCDALRVAEDLCSAMGRGPESYDMRSMTHGLVVSVLCFVIKGGVDGHDGVKSGSGFHSGISWYIIENHCVCVWDWAERFDVLGVLNAKNVSKIPAATWFIRVCKSSRYS